MLKSRNVVTSQFPSFYSHEQVSCFNCGGDMGAFWCDSEYPKGRGQYRQDCEKCRMTTWYDLEKKEAA